MTITSKQAFLLARVQSNPAASNWSSPVWKAVLGMGQGRWSMNGAQAMLKLRSVYLNGDWQRYWAFHRQQEQSRLYGTRNQETQPHEAQKMAA